MIREGSGEREGGRKGSKGRVLIKGEEVQKEQKEGETFLFAHLISLTVKL